MPFQVAVVVQHMQHIVDRRGAVPALRFPVRIEGAVTAEGIGIEAACDGGRRQQLEGDGIARPSEDRSQPALVVLQVRLPPDAQHLVPIDPLDIVRQRFVPFGVPQTVVQFVEEHLDMVRDAAAQPAAHVPAKPVRKFEPIGFGERRKAGSGRIFAPRLQVVGRIDVGVCAQPGLFEERFEADAAGQDHADLPSMDLAVSAQPTEKFIRCPLTFRRDATPIVFEQTVDENRQFVDREHNRPLARRQRREDCVASLRPVSRVDTGAQLHLHVRDGQFFEVFAGLFEDIGETVFDPAPNPTQRSRLNAYLGNRVGRVCRGFQIDENRFEFAAVVQPPQQFPDEAGLAHAPLRGQQRMGSVAHPFPDRFEFRLTVKKPVAVDPIASGFSQHCDFPTDLLQTISLGNTGLSRRVSIFRKFFYCKYI